MSSFYIGQRVQISTASIYGRGKVGTVVDISGEQYRVEIEEEPGCFHSYWINQEYLADAENIEFDKLSDKEMKLFYQGLYEGYKEGIETLIKLIGEGSDE